MPGGPAREVELVGGVEGPDEDTELTEVNAPGVLYELRDAVETPAEEGIAARGEAAVLDGRTGAGSTAAAAAAA